jgi:hypothetical protein
MSVNGTTYSDSLPSGGVGGYQLLLLDEVGQPLNGGGTIFSTDGTGAGDTAMAAALTSDLNTAYADAVRPADLLDRQLGAGQPDRAAARAEPG